MIRNLFIYTPLMTFLPHLVPVHHTDYDKAPSRGPTRPKAHIRDRYAYQEAPFEAPFAGAHDTQVSSKCKANVVGIAPNKRAPCPRR